MTRLFSLAAAALITAAVFAPYAYAGASDPAIEVQSSNIAVRALDLTKPEAQALLRGRIASTARAVCGEDDLRDVSAHGDYKACVAAAQADALARLESLIASANAHSFAQAHSPQAATP